MGNGGTWFKRCSMSHAQLCSKHANPRQHPGRACPHLGQKGSPRFRLDSEVPTYVRFQEVLASPPNFQLVVSVSGQWPLPKLRRRAKTTTNWGRAAGVSKLASSEPSSGIQH
ncbi:unnamed protein product [Parascedosporium putredinis]|uniref:Uncharacterized protein n=1 Tax=Parascedosporium putredinis TaxID=1442378 RepID=A0A9P1MB06_9PEZI|nr:unnamed protein product [Parascedosporium putredinis]CAI7998631.1 unnamed protein product [Parascedosporium putredinis]